MRKFAIFVRAVCKELWPLLSCAVFTAIGIWQAYFEKPSKWIVIPSFSAAAILLLVAMYLAWLRLYSELEAFQTKVPKLSIKILDPEGEYIRATAAVGGGVSVDYARYYHLVVSNENRSTPASDLDVRLTRIDSPVTGGGTRTDWTGNVPIDCRNQKNNPVKHKIGAAVHFDLCSVRQNGGVVVLHPQIYPNNLTAAYPGKCDLILFFKACSIEVDVETCIRVSWDGQWHDGAKEMSGHFQVKQLPLPSSRN